MRWVLCVLIFAHARVLAGDGAEPAEFVVWNVGQGLWTTWKTSTSCTHYDAGGERAPWKLLKDACKGKQNKFNFTHWDLDHVRFAKLATGRLSDACLQTAPRGEASPHRASLLSSLRACTVSAKLAQDLSREPRKKSSTNELSHVFWIRGRALIPGDSTKTLERTWSEGLDKSGAALLVLGHHGSRTATSELLLNKLSGLKTAIASAREKKYGHPHREVAALLRAHGIALLRTEEWGSLRFEIRNEK